MIIFPSIFFLFIHIKRQPKGLSSQYQLMASEVKKMYDKGERKEKN